VVLATEAQEDQLKISVSDTGIGIAAEELDKIFDEFYRCKNAVQSKISGTGLGLSIAKRIVKIIAVIWRSRVNRSGALFSTSFCRDGQKAVRQPCEGWPDQNNRYINNRTACWDNLRKLINPQFGITKLSDSLTLRRLAS